VLHQSLHLVYTLSHELSHYRCYCIHYLLLYVYYNSANQRPTASSDSSTSSITGSSASPGQQAQQQQLLLTTTPATAAAAGIAAASNNDNSSRSAPSTRNAGVSLAQRAFNPTEAALRLQALQEQQLLEIAAQERALKERQAQEKKVKAGDASARGNGHVQYIEVIHSSDAAVVAALLCCTISKLSLCMIATACSV
jgi:hypothetical protein